MCLTTNGTRVTARAARRLAALRSLVRVNVSLDATDAETYRRVRGGDPGRPMEAIQRLARTLPAGKLGVSASTLSRVLRGTSGISPEMALRLEKALGRSAESWLALQYAHDLWQARERVKLRGVSKIKNSSPAVCIR